MNTKRFIKIAILGFILSVIPLLLSACSGSNAKTNANAETTAPAIVEVTTAQAVARQIPTYFEATGNLASDAQTDVAPTVGGKVVAVNFDAGSYVNRGDVLVRLDDRDAQIKLEQARAQVQQAQSNVRQAQAQVDQAKANVRQTQAQLGLSGSERFDVNYVAEVKNAKAALDLAEKELGRATRLVESGDIARTIYDQRKAQYEQALSQYQAALNSAKQRYAAIQTAQAQVDTAQAAARTAQAAAQAAQTQVDQAQKAVADTIVYAPISGYISERSADLGEYVSTQSKIATIVRTSVLRLRIDVPEQSIGKIAVGQAVSAQVSAYPDRNFAGTIVRILPSLNPTSRTLTVEAEIENVGGLLKPGQFATVRIAQSKPSPAVMIPTAAVRNEGDINKVFVIKDGVANERIAQLGLLENDLIEVKQGVQEGETVATSSLDKLGDGVIVRQ